jgi:hypothetical protein
MWAIDQLLYTHLLAGGQINLVQAMEIFEQELCESRDRLSIFFPELQQKMQEYSLIA